ncbi:MAG TPA: lysylphosphatidylglycerol synthase transmembrane domain-containing protein [Acidimicrobiales bacterium]|nr:lysylphosphatidylglycerol synthase transmembrane domain-containing protein [Acidimicrobiales bacterium]
MVPESSDQAASPGSQVTDEPRPLSWKAVVRRAVVIVIAGVALYLVAPKVTAVFTSFPQLASVDFIWLGAALVAQAAHFGCTFALQRIALRTKAWFPVVTAQLAGNAISLIMPGGAAAGAAVQFRMLATSGMDAGEAVGGLTAFSLLGVAGLLALPVFALPAVLFGTPINHSLFDAALLGIVGFVFFAGFSAAVLLSDRPLRLLGQAIQWVRNRIILRHRPPLTGLERQLLTQRDLIRGVLGQQWWKAVLLSAGRLVFDFLCLLCALRAVGSKPSPALVLIAYAVTGIIGMIPITPGGLGIVEASLSGFLVLAGVNSGDAVLATLAYRLASYWLPLFSGPVAYAIFKRRYRHAKPSAHDKAEPMPAS